MCEMTVPQTLYPIVVCCAKKVTSQGYVSHERVNASDRK